MRGKLAVALLLLVPSAGADLPDASARITFNNLDLTGPTTLTGQLNGWAAYPYYTDAAMTLHAQELVVDVVGNSEIMTNVIGGTWERPEKDGDFTIPTITNFSATGLDSYLAVTSLPWKPAPLIQLHSDCLSTLPHDGSFLPLERRSFGSDTHWASHYQGAEGADAPMAIRAQTCSPTHNLTIQGDFLLTLWEWTILVTPTRTVQPAETFWSGRTMTGSETWGSHASLRQIFAYVTNGTFTYGGRNHDSAIYLTGPAGQAEGTLTGTVVEGRIDVGAQAINLDAGNIQSQGRFNLELHRINALSLDGRLQGQMDMAQVESTAIWHTPSPGSPWIWMAFTAAALLSVIVAFGHPLRSGNEWRELAQEARRDGHLHAARWAAWNATLHRGDRGQAHHLVGLIQADLGHHRRALRAFANADARLHRVQEIAANAYQAALTAAAANRTSQAASWLERAATLDPDLLQEAASSPTFAKVGSDPAFRSRFAAFTVDVGR